MNNINQFHTRYIDEAYIEEKSKFGYNPWSVLIEEAKLQDVSSDDEPDELNTNSGNKSSQEEEQPSQEEEQPSQEEEPKLSEEELQQLVQSFQSGELSEEDLKNMLDQGQINNTDIQILQQMIEQSSPEDEQAQQINQVQEMVIRFNIYDKVMALDNKLEIFVENFHEVSSNFYKLR
jgi:flagellar biosynthesis GTPase FlhF